LGASAETGAANAGDLDRGRIPPVVMLDLSGEPAAAERAIIEGLRGQSSDEQSRLESINSDRSSLAGSATKQCP
jgi:hypothetical protein